MKFAKVLAQEAVPEWKKMYIDYNELKRIIKEVIQSYKFADKEYHKDAEPEFPTSLGPDIDLNATIRDRLTHGRRFSLKSMSDVAGPFFAKLSRRSSKTDIRSNAPSFCQSSIQDDMTMEELIPMLNESEQKFFSQLDKELQKIWEFYGSREDYASEKLKELKKAHRLLKQERKKGKLTGKKPDTFKPMNILKHLNLDNYDYYPPPHGQQSGMEQARTVQVITADGQKKPVPMSYGIAKKRIKMGVMEFYRSIQMLKKYAQLNRLGFEKILKKYDKNTSWKASNIYMRKVDATNFSNLKTLDRILKQTEIFYVSSFSDGVRKHAIKRLRMPDKAKSHYFVTWRVGIYLGMAINLILVGIRSVMDIIAFVDKNSIAESCQINPDASLSPAEQQTFYNFCNYDLILQIYAAVVAPIVLGLLVGVNMIAWAKAKINYRLIFDFDTRDNMDHREYLELRVCLPFVYGVEFRDFFVADELVSLQFTFSYVATLICALSNDWEQISEGKCSSNRNPWAVFMATIPALLRFVQCLQRWVKTQRAHPHLLNALKYITIVIPYWILYANTQDALVFWYLVHLFNTLLANFWDLAMDWAFLRVWYVPNYGLREELEFKHRWVYYFAVCSNTLMRFVWMVDRKHNGIITMSFAFMEVLRRFQWNFFRVEKEHVYNVLIKRAVKDINIPFVVTKNDQESTANHQVETQLPQSPPTRRESFASYQTSNRRFSLLSQHVSDALSSAFVRFTPLHKGADFRDYSAPRKRNFVAFPATDVNSRKVMWEEQNGEGSTDNVNNEFWL
ncbi:11685_t:CDS:10 [Paraglomus brasilianum]|uniref:11685_t:CDS:1 n=1 Tax=Paraglomus brasilianum TaxID=144538 RepID=A0A9N8W5G3_9GLOM|nr:11685_t:CDS:10 [Paraglomus brasilianum]